MTTTPRDAQTVEEPESSEMIERLQALARKHAHDGGLSPLTQHVSYTSRELSQALYWALFQLENRDRLLAAVRAEHQQEIETLAKINHDLCDALTRENKRADAAEQQLALLQQERIIKVKNEENDHNAGLIHQVASPLAETEPRPNNGEICGSKHRRGEHVCNREYGHSGSHAASCGPCWGDPLAPGLKKKQPCHGPHKWEPWERDGANHIRRCRRCRATEAR
jgi:hypothetical protein